VWTGPHAVLPVLAHYVWSYLRNPDPMLIIVVFALYVGVVLPRVSHQAERLLSRTRLRLRVLGRAYDLGDTGTDTENTDTDWSVE
jgi:hypothetical protein